MSENALGVFLISLIVRIKKMKKLIKIAVLILFFLTGIAVGMKELPELEPYDPEAVSIFPSDIKKIIAQKTLRLILDEAEENPEILFDKQWHESKSMMEAITSVFIGLKEKAPVIDMIILLIENGAEPNTKNYKGNNVLHLLITDFGKRTRKIQNLEKKESTISRALYLITYGKDDYSEANAYLATPQGENFYYSNYLNALKAKIKFLSQHKINLNAENDRGVTAAHMLILLALIGDSFDSMWSFIGWLKELGLDFTTVKTYVKDLGVPDSITACEFGQILIERQQGLGHYKQNKFNELCFQK
jgi:hypothetical protein